MLLTKNDDIKVHNDLKNEVRFYILVAIEYLKMEGQGRFHKLKKFGKLFAVKPLMMIYGLQYAITGPVSE